MTTYLGPIVTGAPFIFASLQDTVPYILNASKVSGGYLYYWESNYQILTKQTLVPNFTATGSLTSLYIKDFQNGGGMSFREDGVTIGNSPTPSPIVMSQSIYQNWNPPNLFLTSITYDLYNTHGQLGQVLTNASGTGTIPADNIIILPVNYFYNCTDSTHQTNNNVVNTIRNWFCFINSTNPTASYCVGWTVEMGWTELSDCINNYPYDYCPVDTYCGTTGTICNGPCSSTSDQCTFNNDTYNYICKVKPSSVASNWVSSIYFILALMVLGFIIVMGMILLFYFLQKSLNPNTKTGSKKKTQTDPSKNRYLLE